MNGGIMRYVVYALVLMLLPICALAQKKDKADANTRSVQGVVSDSGGSPIPGAIVQLKNTKTLQVRSFVTKEDGSYYFHGLSSNTDYDLKAESGNLQPSSRTLSSFDSRRTAVMNFKLAGKK
jgi:hypothetical protein